MQEKKQFAFFPLQQQQQRKSCQKPIQQQNFVPVSLGLKKLMVLPSEVLFKAACYVKPQLKLGQSEFEPMTSH